MKQDSLTNLSLEELQKKENALKTANVLLPVMLGVMAVLGVFIVLRKGSVIFLTLPVCFLPLALANTSNLKKVREEIAKRNGG